MARKPSAPPPDQPTLLVVPREQASARIEDRVEKGLAIKKRPKRSVDEIDAAKNDYYTWTEYNKELLQQMFTTPQISVDYSVSSSIAALSWVGGRSPQAELDELHKDIDEKIRRLQSIRGRLELIPVAPGVSVPNAAPHKVEAADKSAVFIVHGQDDAAREAVARFISKLDLQPIILHEQASQGRTIVEKLEAHGGVAFAVVLLTPDDLGGPKGANLQPRARQNVVLELGYFLGRLRRQNVCALYRGDLELPSDYMGVIYSPYDGAGGWRLQLAKELKAAGLDVDMNKAL